jgi:2-C-methyl-D-erythritol 2,4-cyclodiphosphate synthase
MIRIGHGFDVHKLVDGRKCIIGGVEIAHDKGLDGHSDADVLLHAICDALLGAASLGDIGKHFPPSDNTYKNANSRVLLRHVVALLHAQNYVVNNIDATVICETPKLSPHTAQMCQNIASDCQVDISQINVKATTTEKLGFTGRGEGIAAEAVCTLVSN